MTTQELERKFRLMQKLRNKLVSDQNWVFADFVSERTYQLSKVYYRQKGRELLSLK